MCDAQRREVLRAHEIIGGSEEYMKCMKSYNILHLQLQSTSSNNCGFDFGFLTCPHYCKDKTFDAVGVLLLILRDMYT